MSFDGLRVVLVGPLPPPAGGMANQTRQLARLLEAERAAVEIVQSNAPCRPPVVGRLPVVRAVWRLLPYLAALWRAAGRADVFHVMANSGWSWHLCAAPALRIAHARGVPAVVNYRGGEAAEFLARSASRVRRSMALAARLIVPSRFLQEIFGRHGMQAEVVPNVVDLGCFFPSREVGSGTAVLRSPHLVVARNLEPIYDNETALRTLSIVLRRHPQARLSIAGSGPEAGRLERLAAELGLAERVRFTGRLDREGMARLYREADIALNPSLADNMPNSVLEAMACGLPVVSTDVGGIPFMVRDGATALLVPPRDAAAAAAAVEALLGDAGLRERVASAGLAQVQAYTWPRVAPVLAHAYRAAIDGAARP
jgi:glycosyltransferase involved in cell wall biosynthesis